MTTTALIVDILIIGFFALCWIFLLIIRFTPYDLTFINIISEGIKVWVTPLTFGVIFVCYQLGLIINWLGAFIVKILFEKKYRDSIYEKENFNYNDVKAIIDQDGSTELHKYLRDDLIIIRLVRSGIINFFLISIFSGFLYYWLIMIFSLISMVVCFIYWYQRYRIYYLRILNVYKVIIRNEFRSESKNNKNV